MRRDRENRERNHLRSAVDLIFTEGIGAWTLRLERLSSEERAKVLAEADKRVESEARARVTALGRLDDNVDVEGLVRRKTDEHTRLIAALRRQHESKTAAAA